MRLFTDKKMTKIDERLDDVVSVEKVRCFAVKAISNAQNLSIQAKSPLAGKARLIEVRVEQAFSSTVGVLAGAGVLDDVGNELVALSFSFLKRFNYFD